jgi:hemoglobin-like flavoprotein
MTPRQIRLVQSSWQRLTASQETVAGLFYAKLFELDPSVASLFHGNMVEQGRRLMTVIGFAIPRLSDIGRLAPLLRNLGLRHVEYGVLDRHYDAAGTAFLWAIGTALKTTRTTEVREAWLAVYSLIAKTMKEGAAQAQRIGGQVMSLSLYSADAQV